MSRLKNRKLHLGDLGAKTEREKETLGEHLAPSHHVCPERWQDMRQHRAHGRVPKERNVH